MKWINHCFIKYPKTLNNRWRKGTCYFKIYNTAGKEIRNISNQHMNVWLDWRSHYIQVALTLQDFFNDFYEKSCKVKFVWNEH